MNETGGTNPIMKATDTQNVTVHVRAIRQMPGGEMDQMETTAPVFCVHVETGDISFIQKSQRTALKPGRS